MLVLRTVGCLKKIGVNACMVWGDVIIILKEKSTKSTRTVEIDKGELKCAFQYIVLEIESFIGIVKRGG